MFSIGCGICSMSKTGFSARSAASLGLTNMGLALRVADFRIYLVSNCVSLIGLWVQRIAVQALAWSLTHSATWLGIIALVDLAPALIIGPYAGAMADRLNRKRLAYITQILATVQAIALAGFTLIGQIDIWLLFVLTLAGGINTAFWGPVRQSIVPNLVPRQYLSTAVALGSLNFHLARFIGPAVAGPVILFIDIGAAFVVNAVSYFAFLAALSFINVPRGSAERDPADAKAGGLFVDMMDGLRYVARHRGIAPLLIVLFIGGTALRPVVELLAGYADTVHGQGAAGFALLTSSMGAGALIVSIWLAIASSRVDHLKIVIVSGVLGGAALSLFGFSHDFSLAVIIVGAASGAITLNGVSGQILLQLTVPDSMRGRVLSLYTAIFRGTPALGALIIGGVADVMGFRIPLVAAGLFSIVIFAWMGLRYGHLATHLGELPETQDKPRQG
jgi:MFS family permease